MITENIAKHFFNGWNYIEEMFQTAWGNGFTSHQEMLKGFIKIRNVSLVSYLEKEHPNVDTLTLINQGEKSVTFGGICSNDEKVITMYLDTGSIYYEKNWYR